MRLFVGKHCYLTFCIVMISCRDALAFEKDCGAAKFSQQISDTASKIVKRVPVEPIVSELPTDQGTPECLRVQFRLTPGGKPWSVSTPESSGNFVFNLAAMRAFAKYEFKGSWWGIWKSHVLVLNGVYNKKPEDWGQADKHN